MSNTTYPYPTYINLNTVNDNIFENISKFLGRYPDNSIKKNDESNSYFLSLKIPGYEKNEINISLKNDSIKNKFLSVKAENKEYGKYIENINVQNNIDEKSIKASLKNGILKISFSLEKEKSKLINIELL